MKNRAWAALGFALLLTTMLTDTCEAGWRHRWWYDCCGCYHECWYWCPDPICRVEASYPPIIESRVIAQRPVTPSDELTCRVQWIENNEGDIVGFWRLETDPDGVAHRTSRWDLVEGEVRRTPGRLSGTWWISRRPEIKGRTAFETFSTGGRGTVFARRG